MSRFDDIAKPKSPEAVPNNVVQLDVVFECQICRKDSVEVFYMPAAQEARYLCEDGHQSVIGGFLLDI